MYVNFCSSIIHTLATKTRQDSYFRFLPKSNTRDWGKRTLDKNKWIECFVCLRPHITGHIIGWPCKPIGEPQTFSAVDFYNLNNCIWKIKRNIEKTKQAGAELCQAQGLVRFWFGSEASLKFDCLVQTGTIMAKIFNTSGEAVIVPWQMLHGQMLHG